MSFALATLHIPVTVNTSGFLGSMSMVRNTARESMVASMDSVRQFENQVANSAARTEQAAQSIRSSTAGLQASATRDFAAATGSVQELQDSMLSASRELARAAANMEASNQQIARSAAQSAQAVESIGEQAAAVSLDGVGAKVSEAFRTGLGDAHGEVASFAEKTGQFIKEKLIIIGVAAAVGITAAAAGAIYAVYKSVSFVTGLLTGESYKSENIDALVAQNDKVLQLQASLRLSAVEAGALGDALDRLGVPRSDYVQVYNAAAGAVRTNADELERLGIQYKDNNGQLLQQEQFLRNVRTRLEEYTDGWDRSAAAAAIGVGSYDQVVRVLQATAAEQAASRERLNDFNLGIGSETQKAVAAYQAAMREFAHESELTSLGFKRAIADQVMPILTDLAQYFKDGFPTAVNIFRYSMATITSLFYGLKTAAYTVAEAIIGSLMATGSAVAGVTEGFALALTGDFTGARVALVQGLSDARDRLGAIGENIVAQARRNSDAMRLAWGLDDRRDPLEKIGGKPWVPAPKPDKPGAAIVDPYEALIKSARERAAVLESETDATGRLTVADRELAKYLSALESGYIALNTAQEAVLLAELGRGAVAEITKRQAEENRKLLEASAAAQDKYTEAISSQLAKLQEEADTINLTDIAKQRITATHQVEAAALANLFKTRVDANGQLVRELAVTVEAASAQLIKMEADKKAVAVLIDRVAAQKLLVQYEQEMGQLRVDRTAYFDQSVKALALLELEVAKRRQVIDSLQEDSDKRRELMAQFDEWYSLSRDKIQADKFISVWQSVDQVAHQTFTSIFEGGKSTFTKLRDTLKSTLLDLLYQMTVKKWVFSITASVTGNSAIANAAGGIGSGLIGDALSSAGNFLGLTGPGSMVDSVMGLFGAGSGIGGVAATSAELAGTIASTSDALLSLGATAAEAAEAAGALGATMGTGGGIGAVLSAIPGAGWAAIGALAVLGLSGGGETRMGGQYLDTALVAAPSGGQIGNAPQTIAVATATINTMLKSLDARERIKTSFTGLEQSENGKGFAYVRGVLNTGATFGDWSQDGYNQRRGSMTAEQAQAAYVGEWHKAGLDILQTAAGLRTGLERQTVGTGQFDWVNSGMDSGYAVEIMRTELVDTMGAAARAAAESASVIPKTIRDMLRDVDVRSLADDAAIALIGRINTAITVVQDFRKVVDLMPIAQLRDLSFDAAHSLVQLAGGLQTLSTNLASYVDNFYSEQERRQATARNIAATLNAAGLGYTADQVLNATKEQFRAVTDQFLAMGEAGQRGAVALLSVNAAFAQMADATAETQRQADQDRRQNVLDGVARAMATLSASVEAERTRLQTDYENSVKRVRAQIEGLNATVSKLSQLDSMLRSAAERYITTPTVGLGRGAAVAQISTAAALARSAGILPDVDQLRPVLAVLAQPSAQLYASFKDYARAFNAEAAATYELQALTGEQLDTDRATLDNLKDQLDVLEALRDENMARLDGILQAAQASVDAINGVRSAVLSTADARAAFDRTAAAATTALPPVAGAVTDAQIQGFYATLPNSQTGAKALYDAAIKHGVPSARLEGVLQLPAGSAAAWAVANGLPAFAMGAAFSNGIVRRPTLFPMGQMGEAGDEGILPLANVNGRLGVRAAGAGGARVEQVMSDVLAELRGGEIAQATRKVQQFLEDSERVGIRVTNLRGEALKTTT